MSIQFGNCSGGVIWFVHVIVSVMWYFFMYSSFHMLSVNCKLTVARGVTFQAYRISCAFYYGYAVVLCVLRSATFQTYHAHRTICYKHKNVASPTLHNLLIFYQFQWMNSGFRSTSSYRIRFNTSDNFCLYLQNSSRYSICSMILTMMSKWDQRVNFQFPDKTETLLKVLLKTMTLFR